MIVVVVNDRCDTCHELVTMMLAPSAPHRAVLITMEHTRGAMIYREVHAWAPVPGMRMHARQFEMILLSLTRNVMMASRCLEFDPARLQTFPEIDWPRMPL